MNDTNKIIIMGNYMKSNHDVSRIIDPIGIAPCVKENHGTVTAVIINLTKLKRDDKL